MTATLNDPSRIHPLVASAARMRDWLLGGPAQIRFGAEAGGVAGTLNAAGQPDYVYGEITGYYLHWLAGSHLSDDPRRAANARAALAWCERRYGAGLPVPTRIALQPQAPDWRNDCEFCFDLAMLVGGLSAAAQAGLIEAPRALLDALLARLGAFASGDRLLPVLGAAALPDRWSTRSGPFLIKAAARILSAERWVKLPAKLRDACHGHPGHFLPQAQDPLADPLHPTLYFLEGTLALAPERAPAMRTLLLALLDQADAHGTLPESAATPGVRRSDIIAQALRVGICLLPATDAPRLQPLVDALLARVREDGSIAFRPEVEPPQINIWCAMFVEQALSGYAAWCSGKPGYVAAAEIV